MAHRSCMLTVFADIPGKVPDRSFIQLSFNSSSPLGHGKGKNMAFFKLFFKMNNYASPL